MRIVYLLGVTLNERILRLFFILDISYFFIWDVQNVFSAQILVEVSVQNCLLLSFCFACNSSLSSLALLFSE